MTEPETPETEPEQPVTEPETPETEPEQPVTEPETPETEPEVPGDGAGGRPKPNRNSRRQSRRPLKPSRKCRSM